MTNCRRFLSAAVYLSLENPQLCWGFGIGLTDKAEKETPFDKIEMRSGNRKTKSKGGHYNE
jgi:hypothetical protein